jgi:hypothetical protein
MKKSTSRLLAQIEALAHYWLIGPRAIGQTFALRRGAENCDRTIMVLAHSRAFADDFQRAALMKGNVVVGITPDDLPERLRGVKVPLLADHHVMGRLLYEAANEIRELEALRDDVRRAAERAARGLEALRDDVRRAVERAAREQ